MKKILSLVLGLLWALPVWGACQNLYNESAVTDGYFYNADFEWTENASTYTTDFMGVAQGTYVLSVNKKANLSSPVNVRVNLFDANKVIKSQLVFSIDNGTTDLDIEISIPVDVSYVRASSNPTFVTFESFLPINCVNSCRNLADMTEQNIVVGKYISAEGIISDSEYNFTYMTFIPVKPNTTYTLSFSSPLYFASVSEYSTASDGGFITRQTKYSTSITEPFDLTDFTFTTGATTNYIRWGSNMYKSRTITLSDVLSLNYMFEEGDTATAYVPYCEKIKIATTKYNETAFSPLNTALANAISVVDTVVSNTITQAASIATLQAQKQTRPNDIADDSEKCPAGKKCLLVEDASGVPHWYEIVESILRTDYTELEYLRSDGRAYINTNYSPTSKTRIEVVAKLDSGAGNVNIVGSGHGTTGDAGNALLVINSLDDNIAEIKFAPTGAWIRSENVNMLEKNRLSLSATKFSVNGDVKETNNKTIPDTDNQPFYIFQRWRPSIASTNSKTQVYEFSIYENDILVRNMIPVKRNSDGAIGMFDTVNDVFYTNAGTGEFIAGDPVVE